MKALNGTVILKPTNYSKSEFIKTKDDVLYTEVVSSGIDGIYKGDKVNVGKYSGKSFIKDGTEYITVAGYEILFHIEGGIFYNDAYRK